MKHLVLHEGRILCNKLFDTKAELIRHLERSGAAKGIDIDESTTLFLDPEYGEAYFIETLPNDSKEDNDKHAMLRELCQNQIKGEWKH